MYFLILFTAFIEGYADNEKCLAREFEGKPGIPLTTDKIKYGPDAPTLYAMLDKGEVAQTLLLQYHFLDQGCPPLREATLRTCV